MNTVEVNPTALDAEADRLLDAAPAEVTGEAPAIGAGPGAGDTFVAGAGQGSWNEVTPGLVAAASIVLLPQWNLVDDERTQLSRAIGDVLDQIFPGGLNDPRWAPWVRLVAVSTAIVFTRLNPETGKLPAIGPKRVESKPDAKTGADVDDRKAA